MISFTDLQSHPQAAADFAQNIINQTHLSGSLQRHNQGSQILFFVGQSYVLKIFNPEDKPFFDNEHLYLKTLNGNLPVKTPHLVTSGYHEEIPFLVMEKINGLPLNQIREKMNRDQYLTVLFQIGKTIRALHQLDPTPLVNAPHHWETLIKGQAQNLIQHHAAYGTESSWLDQIENYLDFNTLDAFNPTEQVPLHTELMPEHIFFRQQGDQFLLNGLIDFEPAMLGHRYYEFAAVGVFLCPGDAVGFGQFLRGYGLEPQTLPKNFSKTLMSWLLLHRYCNLTWFLTMLPPNQPQKTLTDCQKYWFSFC